MKSLMTALWGATGGATLAVALGATIASGTLLLVTAGTLQTFIGPGPPAGEAAPDPAVAMPTAASGPALQPTSDTPPVPTAPAVASAEAAEPLPDGSTDPALDPAQTAGFPPNDASPPPDQTDLPTQTGATEPTPRGSGPSEEPAPSPSPSPPSPSDPAASPSPSAGPTAEPSSSPIPPIITSPAEATFAVGSTGTFIVTSSAGDPAADIAVSCTGSLPDGVSFTDNGDGTASISGTPAAGTQGTYELTLTVSNGSASEATQRFTLHVVG